MHRALPERGRAGAGWRPGGRFRRGGSTL